VKTENTTIRKPAPELSVVVAVIEGGRTAMKTCLEALAPDAESIKLECIVPFDARLNEVDELKARFPWVKFIDARDCVVADEFGQTSREHHDMLRAIGLREASAPIVALVEDHGTPAPGWCAEVLAAHRGSEAAGIGGAVENGVDRLLNWAVYYCDFGRYQNPVPDGAVEFLSDSNVSYKRDALWSVKNQWFNAFHETSVNWELIRRGAILSLNSKMVAFQTRRTLRMGNALRERYVWGRSFAGTRVQEVSTPKRVFYTLFSFLLPLLLTSRILRQGFHKKRHLRELLSALPMVFLLETIWALGEFVGYLTGRAAATDSHDVLGESEQLSIF
jgi:hypothetical protein